MSALSANRNSPRRDAMLAVYVASATIYAGGMVTLLTSGGTAVPAGTASAGHCVGVAQNAAASGDSVTVERGCYRFANSTSGDLIALSDIGQLCYIVDDQTVAKTDNSGARKVAGLIVDADDNGVWVQFGVNANGNYITNLNRWAVALATKLNADAGVTDTNYDTDPQA